MFCEDLQERDSSLTRLQRQERFQELQQAEEDLKARVRIFRETLANSNPMKSFKCFPKRFLNSNQGKSSTQWI